MVRDKQSVKKRSGRSKIKAIFYPDPIYLDPIYLDPIYLYLSLSKFGSANWDEQPGKQRAV